MVRKDKHRGDPHKKVRFCDPGACHQCIDKGGGNFFCQLLNCLVVKDWKNTRENMGCKQKGKGGVSMDRKYTLAEIVTAFQFCDEKKDVLCTACAFCGLGDSCRSVRNTHAVEFLKMMDLLIGTQEITIRAMEVANRWIPVSERLPAVEEDAEEDPQVLAIIDGATVSTALYFNGEEATFYSYETDGVTYYPVTHWRPMPKGVEVKNDTV